MMEPVVDERRARTINRSSHPGDLMMKKRM